jgi:hypothetical protein
MERTGLEEIRSGTNGKKPFEKGLARSNYVEKVSRSQRFVVPELRVNDSDST